MLRRNNMWQLNFAVKSIFRLQRLWNWFRRLTVMRTTIFQWHKQFREGRESVKDDKHSGRPTTSWTDDNIATVDKMVKEDRKVTPRLIADTLSILKTVILWILSEDLKKWKLCSRFGSNNSTVSDSKTSCNIEPPPHSRQICLPLTTSHSWRWSCSWRVKDLIQLKGFRKPWPTS